MAEIVSYPSAIAHLRPEVDVTMTYAGLLRRSPDRGGFTYWSGKVRSRHVDPEAHRPVLLVVRVRSPLRLTAPTGERLPYLSSSADYDPSKAGSAEATVVRRDRRREVGRVRGRLRHYRWCRRHYAMLTRRRAWKMSRAG